MTTNASKAPPAPDLFSYASLSRADEAAAREDAALIKAHMKTAAESIIAVGLALKRQKEQLPHGMFLPWIAAEFQMGEATAKRFMSVARYADGKSLTLSVLNATALYELAAPSTPQPIRDAVETLLVDGQKVTVADIRRMKAEAKQAQANADALASRNVEMARGKRKEPAVDAGAIRAESAEAIASLERRVAELSSANSHLTAELQTAQRAEPAPTTKDDPTNVVRPNFRQADTADDSDSFRAAEDYSPAEAINAFAGLIESANGLQFGAAEFWAQIGKTSTDGRIKYDALLNVNTIVSFLIKEYAK